MELISVCRPEVYRTRLLCYRFLSFCRGRIVGQLPREDPAVPSAAIVYGFNLMRELIALFDDIIVSEWDPDHEKLRRYTGQQIPTCSFCGCDIFQSFFECSLCGDLDASSTEAYHICATCYVEGRSCLCRVMTPMQRWSFEVLVEDRNRSAAVVNDWAAIHHQPSVIVMDEK